MIHRRKLVAPINTIKHYVHQTRATVNSGAILGIKVAESVVAPATANAFSVKEGSILKAVHLEYWACNSDDTLLIGQYEAVLEKVPSGQASITAAQIVNIGAYPNKKNILWTFQGLISPAIDGGPNIPIIRDWILIPKGKQRFGLSDELVLTFASTGSKGQVCGLATYKEWT